MRTIKMQIAMKQVIKPEEDILFLTKHLSKLIRKQFDQKLNTYGLTGEQGRLLFTVDKVVRIDHKEIHQNDLEKKFRLSKSTISGLVKRLEKKELIQVKKSHPYVLIEPTEKGSQIVDSIFDSRLESIEDLFKGFTSKEQEQLIRYIHRMILNLEGGSINEKED